MSSNASWQVLPDKDSNYAESPKFELSKEARLYAKSLKKNERWTISSPSILLIVVTKGQVIYTEKGADKNTIYEDEQYVAIDEKYALQVKLSKAGAQLVCIKDTGCSFVVFLVKSEEPDPQSRLELRSKVAKKFDGPVVGKDFAFTFDSEGKAAQVDKNTLVTLAAPNNLERFIHVRVDTKLVPPFSFSENGPSYGGSPPGRISIARISDLREDYSASSALNLYVLLPSRSAMLTTNHWLGKLNEITQPHFKVFGNRSTTITLNSLAAEESIPEEVHAEEDQIVLIINGALKVEIEGEESRYYLRGDAFAIKAGKRHTLTNDNNGGKVAEFISTYAKV